MPTRGVIFDLGGTLLTLPGVHHARVARECAAHLRGFLRAAGVSAAQADAVVSETREAAARRQGGRSRAQLTREANLDRALRRSGVRFPPRMVGAAALAWCQPEFALWRPAAGVGQVLDALHGDGLRLGLCSNTACHAYILLHLVAAHGLGRHLDPVVTSAGVGWRKPDRRAFLPLLQAWDLPPGDVMMVGDDLECDVGGAAALGMRAVWVAPPDGLAGRSGPPAPPWRTVRDLREVPGLVLPPGT